MNVYDKIDISFIYDGKDYELHPQYIDDYNDSINLVSDIRYPNIERGCIGDLVLTSHGGCNIETGKKPCNQVDFYSNVLLSKILVWSNDEDESIKWAYIFLKE